jgi:hypothetical protein
MEPGHNQQSTIKNQQSQIDWPTAIQFGLSLLGILILWGLAAGMLAGGLMQTFNPPSLGAPGLSLLLMAAGLAFSGILLVPSAGYSLARLIGRSPERYTIHLSALKPVLWILALPVVLLAGWAVSKYPGIDWLILPWLQILGVGLPVLWVAYLGLRHLPLGTPQRMWGVFGSGLVLGPALILAAELAALIAIAIAAILFISSQPDLTNQLMALAQRLSRSPASQDQILQQLAPYLLKPGVIFTIFVFTAGIVPLIEEAIKPIGVWLLAGRILTPAAGLAAGILSGAGYALFESLTLGSNSGSDWATVVFVRSGTAIIHILTTALTGWALSLAWSEGRYLRLGATYIAAVLIHGTWNSLSLANSYKSILDSLQPGQNAIQWLYTAGSLAPYLLAAMAVAGLLALLWANRTVRRGIIEKQPYSLEGDIRDIPEGTSKE